MKDQILEIIRKIKNDKTINEETHLVFESILSSLDILQLICELQEKYNIIIPVEEVLPDNFDSIDGITKLIERLQG